MENLEGILEEIEKYDRNGYTDDMSSTLEDYLKFVAKTGDPLFPWSRIKNLIRFKLSSVMSEFYSLYGGEEADENSVSPNPTRDKILQHFDSFSGAPFTIQRICEILVDPTRHYKRTDKFLRGMEKNIFVVSVVEPGYTKRMAERQISLVNGLQESGMIHISVSHSTTHIDNEFTVNDICDEEGNNVGEEQVNGNVSSDGVADDSSSSSSSSSSSTSSSPTPDEDNHELGPSAKRPRLESRFDSKDDVDYSTNCEDDGKVTSGMKRGEVAVSDPCSCSDGRASSDGNLVSKHKTIIDGHLISDRNSPSHSEDVDEVEEVGTSDCGSDLEMSSQKNDSFASATSEVDSSMNEDEEEWNEECQREDDTAEANGTSPDSAQERSSVELDEICSSEAIYEMACSSQDEEMVSEEGTMSPNTCNEEASEADSTSFQNHESSPPSSPLENASSQEGKEAIPLHSSSIEEMCDKTSSFEETSSSEIMSSKEVDDKSSSLDDNS